MKLTISGLRIIVTLALCQSHLCCIAQDGAKGCQPPPTPDKQPAPPDDNRPIFPAHGQYKLTFGPLTPSGRAVKAAQALFRDGKYMEALDMCDTAQQLVQSEGKTSSYDSGVLELTIGFSLVEMGDDAAALKRILPIFKRPTGGPLSDYTAIALARTGDVAGAAKALESREWGYWPPAVENLWKPPKQDESGVEIILRAWHYLGEDSLIQGDYNAALGHFKSARELDSHNTLVAYDLGRAYSELHQYKDAVVEFAWAAKSSYPDLRAEAKKELGRAKGLQKSQPPKPAQQ